MIIVDTNVVAYLMLPGPYSEQAETLMVHDSDWHMPLLWRSEFRSVLAGYLRAKKMDRRTVKSLMKSVERMFSGREHPVDSDLVLDLLSKSLCSAYDCEFVALAMQNNCHLVTVDKAILRDFPQVAISLNHAVMS